MDQHCEVEGETLAGPNLRRANYVNNFKITCSQSNVSFDLECNTNNNNEMISKLVQGESILYLYQTILLLFLL